MQRILARKYKFTPLGTGGKGEVFMAVENVPPLFSLQPCNISLEAIIYVLVFVKNEFTVRKQCKTGVIAYIVD